KRSMIPIGISMEVSLNERAATKAAFGFSPEQEMRIAESFIIRIKTELDEIEPAYRLITKQTSLYPPNASIPERDLYGVSLLYHRAGHLALSKEKLLESFNYFRHSAELSIEMEQFISAAINIENMAYILTKMDKNNPSFRIYRRDVERLDDEVSSHLFNNSILRTTNLTAVYHNNMGVYALLTKTDGDTLSSGVERMLAIKRAVSHFTIGIRGLEETASLLPVGASKSTIKGRRKLYLLSLLHYNMAEIATTIGEQEKAFTHLDKVMRFSKKGMFPELRWRALALKGDLDGALREIEHVTLLRANSLPGEIMSTFSPLVNRLISSGKVEEAFNLVERLSEIERINRMAPILIGSIKEDEKKKYLTLYRRFKRINELEGRLEHAKGDERGYIEDMLMREEKLLKTDIGEHWENMPTLASLPSDRELSKKVIMLIGTALKIENTAKTIANATEENEKLYRAYNQLLDEYKTHTEELAELGYDNSILALFAP
ncbi:MAG: hypothetical protein D6828_02505, partial [Nitrospirae bacterium]